MSQPNPNPQDPRLTVAEARDHLLSTLTPVAGWECVAIRDALGRVLSRPVIAPFDVPAHDNSAMDGYAVRFDDLASGAETELRMVGTAYAGRAFSGIVGAGQAVRVMTGAVVPKGSDTIVVQEVTRVDGERVFVPPGQRQGQNLRRAGEDLARGKPALAAGKRIGAADLGLLASLGVAEVTVFRRLRVAFMSTGDEIASIGNPLGPGQVYDSNRYTLHAALSALGVDLVDMGVIRDQPALIEEAFRDPRVQVSAFALSFQPEGWDLRLVAWGGNLRCRLRGTPYGDQALAFRASSLAALGGLPAWPYLEDLWCVTRLKAPGFLRLLPGHCPTSGRRYRERGVWRTLWQHQRILAHFRRHGCPLPEDR